MHQPQAEPVTSLEGKRIFFCDFFVGVVARDEIRPAVFSHLSTQRTITLHNGHPLRDITSQVAASEGWRVDLTFEEFVKEFTTHDCLNAWARPPHTWLASFWKDGLSIPETLRMLDLEARAELEAEARMS